MKKLLIIQQDEAYFLFETIQVIEKHQAAFRDFECTILVDPAAYNEVYNQSTPVLRGFTTDINKIKKENFDVTVNLSLHESSWMLHGELSSMTKIGPYFKSGQLMVSDLWSSYLLTLKAKAPFVTFHLQDVYKNILGIKGLTPINKKNNGYTQIAFGMTNTEIFPAKEQEAFINELAQKFSHLPIKDITEIDLVSDVSQTLYIGPANLEALKLCESGGKGIFFTTQFQGFNLLPYDDGHLFISNRESAFESKKLLSIVEAEINEKNIAYSSEYSIYRTDHENMFGAYLKSLNQSDDNYPFYQSHVVLWNFLLNLFDTNLEVTRCSKTQLHLLKSQHEVLSKFLRLHDYAMVSIDTIYQEAKSSMADGTKIEGHIKNLQEIDQITEKISNSHSLLRPVLDFYRIRRGQNNGQTLLDQTQLSYLSYSEEHQALSALNELFSVTLKRNEVSI